MRGARSGSTKFASAAAGLLLAVAVGTAGPPAGARVATAQQDPNVSGIEMATLATRRLDEVPPGRRWVLRRGHPLNEDAHAHAGGFIYAARGASYLVVEDSRGFQMREGEAAWAPQVIGHLHTTAFRSSNSGLAAAAAGNEIWTILLEEENDARKPGASTARRRRTGPELAYALDGAWELEYDGVPLALAAAQGYLADPDVPHRLRNVGSGPAHLLSAQLVPDGKPAEEPVSTPSP